MIKEYTIGFSRTVNLGNFESARVEASVTWTIEPHESIEASHFRAQKQLRLLLEETWTAQHINQRKPEKAGKNSHEQASREEERLSGPNHRP